MEYTASKKGGGIDYGLPLDLPPVQNGAVFTAIARTEKNKRMVRIPWDIYKKMQAFFDDNKIPISEHEYTILPDSIEIEFKSSFRTFLWLIDEVKTHYC